MCRHRLHVSRSFKLALVALAAVSLSGTCLADGRPFLDRFNVVNTLASTVPANGDVNPYGVALVPRSVGMLKRGQILVSNFNNNMNPPGGRAGHRNDHRANQPRWERESVRTDRPGLDSGRMSGRCWAL